MTARIVSLVLIASVVACPLSCGSGICHAGQCCAVDGSDPGRQCAKIAGTRHAVADCDCCDIPSHERDEHGPPPCRGKTKCQGICGGAVFEKPHELATANVFFLPQLHSDDDTFVSLLSVRRTNGFEITECVSSGNQGRFVRTLYMSLIC